MKHQNTDAGVSLPVRRTTGETTEERLTANAYDSIIPARYLKKDEDGEPIEAQEELFNRIAKNIAVAEAVHVDATVKITPQHIKPDHPRRDEMIDEVFDDVTEGFDDSMKGRTELTEENAKYVSYDQLMTVDMPSQNVRDVLSNWKDEYWSRMENLDFMPNSPTIMNAGDELQQLSACFVNSPADDMDNIYQTLKEAALVMQSGGGMGYAFSYLRPYGDIVGSSGGIASGPMSFMSVYDVMCRTIAQGGTRRGAQMGVMRCTHPDVIHFIHSKNKDVSLTYALRLNDPKDYRHNDFGDALEEARTLLTEDDDGNVRYPDHLRNAVEAHLANFNISVTVTDEFMEAVKADEDFPMVNPRTGETHIATEETKQMYSWYGLGDEVAVGEPLEIPASELFDRMVDGAHENGEPGILFIDRANEDHSFPTESTATWDYDEDPYELSTTNPCGEQWLMEDEACNLGHINLSTVADEDSPDWRDWSGQNVSYKGSMDDPEYAELESDVVHFLDEAIDFDELDDRITSGTRFLDNVVTMSAFPTDDIEATVSNNRKIGLGVMGLAQLFIQLGVEYGSEVSEEITRQVMRHIDHKSKHVSHSLAKSRGRFDNWEDSKYAEPTKHREWFERHTGLNAETWANGFRIRNHNTVTIAPTGTTSMLGNTSGGCEPIYNVAYKKNVSEDVQGDEQLVEFDDYFLDVLEANDIDVDEAKAEAAEQMSNNEFEGVESLTTVPDEVGELFVVTADLSGKEHAGIQCAAQESVDSAISKTVNFPNSATKDEVADVLLYLYENGAKGGTIYRDGTRSKQVLSTREDHGLAIEDDDLDRDDAKEIVEELIAEHGLEDAVVPSELRVDSTPTVADSSAKFVDTRDRPKVLDSRTERLATGYGKLYVTVSFDEDGDPFEVFGEMGKSGGFTHSMVEGLCRSISLALRSGVPVGEVIDQQIDINAPEVGFDQGQQVQSIPDGIAKALKSAVESRQEETIEVKSEPDPTGEECPSCGADVKYIGGCPQCAEECGWSKC